MATAVPRVQALASTDNQVRAAVARAMEQSALINTDPSAIHHAVLESPQSLDTGGSGLLSYLNTTTLPSTTSSQFLTQLDKHRLLQDPYADVRAKVGYWPLWASQMRMDMLGPVDEVDSLDGVVHTLRPAITLSASFAGIGCLCALSAAVYALRALRTRVARKSSLHLVFVCIIALVMLAALNAVATYLALAATGVMASGASDAARGALTLINDARRSAYGLRLSSSDVFEGVKASVVFALVSSSQTVFLNDFLASLVPKLQALSVMLERAGDAAALAAMNATMNSNLRADYEVARAAVVADASIVLETLGALQTGASLPGGNGSSYVLAPLLNVSAVPPLSTPHLFARSFDSSDNSVAAPNLTSIATMLRNDPVLPNFYTRQADMLALVRNARDTIAQELIMSSSDFLIRYFWQIEVEKRRVDEIIAQAATPALMQLWSARTAIRGAVRTQLSDALAGFRAGLIVAHTGPLILLVIALLAIVRRNRKAMARTAVAFTVVAALPFISAAALLLASSAISRVCDVYSADLQPVERYVESASSGYLDIAALKDVRAKCSSGQSIVQILKERNIVTQDFSDLNASAQDVLSRTNFTTLMAQFDVRTVLNLGGNLTLTAQTVAQRGLTNLNISRFDDVAKEPMLSSSVLSALQLVQTYNDSSWSLDDNGTVRPVAPPSDNEGLDDFLRAWSAAANATAKVGNATPRLDAMVADINATAFGVRASLNALADAVVAAADAYEQIAAESVNFNAVTKVRVVNDLVPQIRGIIADFFLYASSRLDNATECRTHFATVNATVNAVCVEILGAGDAAWGASWVAAFANLAAVPVLFIVVATLGNRIARAQDSTSFSALYSKSEVGSKCEKFGKSGIDYSARLQHLAKELKHSATLHNLQPRTSTTVKFADGDAPVTSITVGKLAGGDVDINGAGSVGGADGHDALLSDMPAMRTGSVVRTAVLVDVDMGINMHVDAVSDVTGRTECAPQNKFIELAQQGQQHQHQIVSIQAATTVSTSQAITQPDVTSGAQPAGCDTKAFVHASAASIRSQQSTAAPANPAGGNSTFNLSDNGRSLSLSTTGMGGSMHANAMAASGVSVVPTGASSGHSRQGSVFASHSRQASMPHHSRQASNALSVAGGPTINTSLGDLDFGNQFKSNDE